MSNGVYVAMIELQALNYVFSKNSLRLFVNNGITEEHFTTYKNHYNFVVSFFNEYNQLPSRETFQSKFEGEWEWITVSDPEEYLIEKLKEAKLYRDVIVEYKKIGELIKDEKTDKAVEKMASISQQFMRLQNSNCVRLIEDVQMRVDGYLERVNNPDKAFVSTGLMELDEILGGWDLLNESATICARTGIGKSWMLVYFAMNAAKAGLRVGYYSGEMESDLVGYRFDTLFANIANGSLIRGNPSIKEQYSSYAESLKESIKGEIFCITPDDPMFNGEVTVAKLKAFIEKYDLQMLCIDQFSLLDDQRKARTAREQAVNISKDLRKLQRMKKIPILSAVQLNREETEGGPTTKNISESDRIGQDSTTVLFIETKGDTMSITVGKARNARSGDKLNYAWNKNLGIIRFIPTENDARDGRGTDEVQNEYSSDLSDSVF